VTWQRAGVLTLCGGTCGGSIQPGEPMCVLELSALTHKRQRIRCVRCAAHLQQVPPLNLPPLVEREQVKPMLHIKAGRDALPFDWKAAQVGHREREPGEDDE
jgi:hypothetical protein